MAIKKQKGSKRRNTRRSDSTSLIDFAFITAIEVERVAVCNAFKLTARHRVRKGARVYWQGRLALKGGEYYEIVVAQSPEMAQVEAALLTNDTIHDWDPTALLLVGVAGAASDGSKEDDEALGDVILGKDVYYYERGKVAPDGMKGEPIIYRADATLWNSVITLPLMRSRVPVVRPDGKKTRPTILQGVIASGEKVIAEAAARDEIAKGHRKTLAIEMEGYGFSAAVWQSAVKRHHLVIKAICDRADRNKTQDWQPYAAAAAAQYAKHFLKDQPLEPRNKQPKKDQDSDPVENILRKQKELERNQQQTKAQIAQMQAMLDQLAFREDAEDIEPQPISFGEAASELSVQPLPSQARSLQSGSAGADPSINGLLSALSAVAGALSREKTKEIEEIRELNREGKLQDALRRIRAMREDQSWRFVEDKVQAKALRAEAGMVLATEQDTATARLLMAQAKTRDPEGDDTIIRTLLRFYEDSPAEALMELGEPSNTDAFDLKLILLIYDKRVEDALNLAQNLPEGIQPDADTRRWTALALLMSGDVSSARSQIQDVLIERPGWQTVRALAAVIDYFSCLSPAAVPKGFVPWPQPIDLSLVKVDAESQRLLKKAEEEFAQLAANTQLGEEARKIHEAWRLACIANSPQRQQEALEYCRALLSEDPANHRALLWAVVRDIDVDFASSEKALAELVEAEAETEDPTRIEKIIALVAVRLKLRRPLEAAVLLGETENDFVNAEMGSSWTFWRGQTFVLSGEPDRALAIAEKEPEATTKRRVKFMALREKGFQAGDWQPLVDHLEESFEQTKEGIDLLELFRLKFFLKDWSYLADRSRALVERVRTAEAVRLAVAAAWNGQQPKRCLALLEENGGSFGADNLPSDLRRLQSRCQVRAGLLSQAVKSAESLVVDDPTSENVINLLDVQRQTGDLRGLAVSARTLLQRNDVSPLSFVRAARLVLLEHKQLAKELWKRAKDNVLDDPTLLIETLMLASALGYSVQDPEVKPLFERMQEFAEEGKGTIQVLRGDQLKAWAEENLRQRFEIAENYYKGLVPSQLFAAAQQLQLSEVLHRFPDENRISPNPRLQPAIFIRHGGRSLAENIATDSSSWNLHVDITSLLVAADLEILPEIERCFAPIRISTLLQTALVAQRENLRPPLPARITILKEIIALSDKGLLGDIPDDLKVADSENSLKEKVGARRLSILLKAQAEGGFVVDHFTSILPDELSKHVVQAEDVVESLKALGALSEAEYEGALQILIGNPNGSSQLFPQKTKIFLLGDNLIKLAKAGVLKPACEEFEVLTEGNYLKTARLEIETNNRRTEIESWVATLIDHVREGLTSGTYQGIDISEGMPKVAGDEDEPEQSNWDFASSSQLLRYKCEKNDVLYFDDRTINAYGHRDNIAPIIGISEVLLALRLREEISEQQYFDKLIKLRASNYRYLPINGEEILYHLKRASTGDQGHVLESFELAVLRRYLGACLVDAAYLQRPPLPKDAPNQTGELKFLANTTRAVTEALVGVWADENIAVDIAQAQSEWILRNLYTGLFGVMHLLPNPETRGDGVQHIGLDIGSIFVYGQTIHGSNLEPRGYERRRQFFEWLEGRLVRPRSDADPEALTSAAAAISSTFSDTFARHEKSSDIEVVGRLVKYQFFVDLPESLREAMKLKPELMEWLGFELTDVIDIGPVQFDASAFWRAAADAVNGRPAILPARKEKVADADAMFTFKAVPIAEGGIVIEISDPAGSIFYRYGDKIVGILKDENTERGAMLRRYRSWFDLDAEAFETEVENIVAVDDPQTRLEKVNDLRKRSADYFYWSLREYLIAKNQIPESGVMPPDAESLLRQFGLSTTSNENWELTTALSESAPMIVEDYGLPIALTRFAWLPIKMPQRLVELFRALNAAEKEALLSQFKKEWQSPVGKLHFVDLVLRSSADKQAALDSAKSNLVELFNDEEGVINFAAFKAVLEFVNTEIAFVKGAFEVPPAIRLLLVWAHACHLHDLFCSVGTKPQGLARLFHDMSWRSEGDIILREPNYWNDCLHPRMLNRTVFLTHATALVLGANDQKAQATIGVKETLDEFLSGDEKNERFLQLLRDPELMTNGSGSFLGGDRAKALSTIFDALEVQPLASVSIKDALRQAIENLKANPADPSSWAVVRTAIWDLPLYSDLYDDFSAVVKSLDFDALLAADPATATYATMVAASQLPYFPDNEIRMTLEPKWLALVKHYSAELGQEDYPEDRAAGVIAMLLEGALGMAVELNDPRATSRAWGGLLLRMLNVAPEFAPHLGHLILKRVFELPAAQLHGLFPVLLAVRALDREPL